MFDKQTQRHRGQLSVLTEVSPVSRVFSLQLSHHLCLSSTHALSSSASHRLTAL